MKKKPSNKFIVPKWMIGLKAREPEGTYTPDQVAAVLEMNLLFNGDVESLRTGIQTLIPLVPLKRQKTLKAFLDAQDSNIVEVVTAFITEVSIKLAPILKEVQHVQPEEQPAGTSGQSPVPSTDSEWGDDWDRPSERKPSSRGLRALRSAKRQSSDT